MCVCVYQCVSEGVIIQFLSAFAEVGGRPSQVLYLDNNTIDDDDVETLMDVWSVWIQRRISR